jgi:hypothetical protein
MLHGVPCILTNGGMAPVLMPSASKSSSRTRSAFRHTMPVRLNRVKSSSQMIGNRYGRTSVAAKSSPLNSKGAFMGVAYGT